MQLIAANTIVSVDAAGFVAQAIELVDISAPLTFISALTDELRLSGHTDLTLRTTGAAGAIALNPTVATVTAKPLRAPGLALCDTVFDKDDAPYSSGNLFRNGPVPVYTRHAQGSELDVNATVAAYILKDDEAELLLRRTVGATTITVATINAGIVPASGWYVFHIRCQTKLSKASNTITLVEYDYAGPNASLGVAMTPVAPTKTYTIRDETPAGPISFQVQSTYALQTYSAQMTCALYNPHTQDVL